MAAIGRVVKFLPEMRSFFGKKSWLLLLASVALGAITILASGLGQLSFRPGQILGQAEGQQVELPLAEIARDLVEIPFWKQLLAWGILLLFVLLIGLLLSPEMRRWLIQTFLRVMTTALVIFLIAKRFSDLSQEQELLGIPPAAGVGAPPEPQPLPIFHPPHPSPIFILLASLTAAACFGVVLWWGQRWWQRRQAALALRKPVEELADIARASLDKLSAGGAWDDVIMESYVRMSDVVGERRGLFRHQAMTPGEFAKRLESAGLPGGAVRTLTRLFETVRYGARKASAEETAEAVRCLTAIIEYCGGTR